MFKYFIRSIGIMFFINLGNFHYVDPKLLPIVKEVNKIVETSCNINKIFIPDSSVIIFNDLPDDEVGLCTYSRRGFSIDIDRDFWHRSNEQYRFQLLMHEMYHCYFHQGHTEDPKNFMYPIFNYLPKETVIKQFKEMCK